MEPEPPLVGRCRLLLVRMGADQRGIEVDHVEPGIGTRRPRRRPRLGASALDRVPGRRRRRLRGCATPWRATPPRRTGRADRAAPRRRRSCRRHRRASPPHRPAPHPGHDPDGAAWLAPSPPTTPPSTRPDRPDRPAGERRHGSRPQLPPPVTFMPGRRRLRFTMEVPFWLLAHVLDKHEFPAPEGPFRGTRPPPTPTPY